MKKYLILFVSVLMIGTAFSQSKKSKTTTVEIQTSAECGMCKHRMEEMLNYTKGVKFAELNLDNKKVTVKFVNSVITLEEIKQKLSELGYDADDVKAIPESVKKLPACCQPGGMKKN